MLKKLQIFLISLITIIFISSCTNLENNEFETMYNYENGDVVAMMKTTNGMVNILLETELAPVTTANFIGLAKEGYYNGIIFHRVIKDFMIQGGDPEGTGMGGTSIYGEKFNDEFHAELKNYKYTISMANSGPNTNGSQFFINVKDNNFLDFDMEPLTSKHAVFGEVVQGTENVDKIAKTKTDSNDKPEKEVKIITLEIKEYKDGSFVDYEFNKEEAIKSYQDKQAELIESKKTKKIAKGDNISVHYTGTFENGEKFDSSLDRGQPLDFEVGAGMMIAGFDKAVVDMKIGDKKSITLIPSEAYGERDESKTQVVPRKDLVSFEQAGIKIEKGGILPTQYGQLKILEVTDEEVTLDTNHPMAGKTLNFDIEIVDIK